MIKAVVEWLGHASCHLTVCEKSIYIDPYKGLYVDKADVILVTHSHFDHCDSSKIKNIKKENTIIIAPADCVQKIDEKIRIIKPGENVDVNGMFIEAVHAYNFKRFRSPGTPFHPKGFGVGYLLTVNGKTIYHAGDTDFIPEMNELKRRNISLALLPSGGTYTMDNLEAAEAALAISPKVVIPIHRWETNPEEFKNKVESLSKIKVALLKPGEKYEL